MTHFAGYKMPDAGVVAVAHWMIVPLSMDSLVQTALRWRS